MSLADDLVDRWEEERECGVILSPEALCVDHPELLHEVRYQIKALEAVENGFGWLADLPDASTHSANTRYQPPEVITLAARFRLQHFHAGGGLGQVYLAHDELLNRRVAIKFPAYNSMSSEQVAKFEQEARITSQLDHPGIVPVHVLASHDIANPCYVMRFIDGPTMQQTIDITIARMGGNTNDVYFGADEFRGLLQSFVSLCNIVAFAHRERVLHRDIKPSNVVLGPFGETLLLDWGIAKRFNVTGDQPHDAEGTPSFASPEQLFGTSQQLQETSDIYSLGVTLFYILSGKSPLEIVGWTRYLERIQRPDGDLASLLPKSVPPPLREICRHALRTSPADRYQTATQLASDIDRFMSRQSISVFRDSLLTKLGRAARKRPAMVGASIATAVVVAIASLLTSSVVSKNNRQLRLAVNDVEKANELSLRALRGMVDDIVASRLAERDSLNDEDHRYIQSILTQYTAFADLQHNSIKSRAIRAEAHLQMGYLYGKLSEPKDALKHFDLATVLLDDLHKESKQNNLMIDLATALESIAGIEFESGLVDRAMDTTSRALTVLRQRPLQSGTSEDVTEVSLICANLHRIRAVVFEHRQVWQDAVREHVQASEILEQQLETSPKNPATLFAMGGCLRSLATILHNHRDSEPQRDNALQVANQSVQILTKLNEQHPDVARYQMALSWSHCNYSACCLAFGWERREKTGC